MYNITDFTKLGGLYVYQTTLDRLQTSYSNVLDALADSYGDMVIVSGLIKTGNTVTDGWVVLNKQLYPVVGSAIQDYLQEDTITTTEQFADGSTKSVYTVKRLIFTAVVTGTPWSDFKRLPFATSSLLDAFTNIQTLLNKLVFSEPVILSGCAVTSNAISAGSVYMGGKLMSTPAYAGAFPVYLNNNGVYTNTLPQSPYILFDGGTSQYYADVMKRNTTRTGEVVMHTNADELSYFDAGSGDGKWRWLGWKISTLLQSRVPVGYDLRASNPGGADATAWDAANRTVGGKIGANTRTLVAGNIPEIPVDINTENNGTDGTANGLMVYNGDVEGQGNGWKTGKAKANRGLTASAFDIRQSSAVVIYIERK